MRAHRSIGLVVVTAMVAVASARGWLVDRDPAEWSPVIYPQQQLPIVFSHAKHLARGTACAACHPDAASSRSAVDNLLPTEAACRVCHPIDRNDPQRTVANAPPARCDACHPGFTTAAAIARVAIDTPQIKFSHAAHASLVACTRCHGDLSRVDLATRQQLPTMGGCLGCHSATPDDCTKCHLATLGGLVTTDLPRGKLIPRATGLGDAHGPTFARDHRQEAVQSDATCAACHDRSTCVACHQGVTKPAEFHPANYLLGHAVEARRGKPDCTACHRAQSFCVGCHERSGVGRRGDTQFDPDNPGRAFHPPGWVSRTGGGNRHALDARRNITSCVSCHREDDCLRCHTAEPGATFRASPHPAGWRASARCRALDRGNRRMCLKCHITASELGCDWQAR